MNIEILADELAGAEYARLDDKQAATALNELPPPVERRVPVVELLNGAYQTGMYARLLAAQRDETLKPDVFGELTALLKLVDGPIQEIDLHSAAAQRMMATLTGAGLVAPEEAQMVAALAVAQPPSRAQELGWPNGVTAEDVAAARALLAEREKATERGAAYAALRERLTAGYGAALAFLAADEGAGKGAPEWADVVGRF